MRAEHLKSYAVSLWLFVSAGLVISVPVLAQNNDKAEIKESVIYSKKGADTCLKCHDESSEFPVLDIFKTKHGSQLDERAPFANLQCEACHGPAVQNELQNELSESKIRGGHTGRVKEGEKRPPILNFGKDSLAPVEKQNSMCLGCHQGKTHIGWQNSTHANADVACASCHKVHVVKDPVLSKKTQANVCFDCHQHQRAEFFRRSSHPVRSGQMSCSDCHTTHASISDSLLKQPTLNQTCYQCHAEKRGPLLWEHAPVTEDCSQCHRAHGSIHSALLTKNTPLLCQQCHSQLGHPSVSHNGSGLPGGSASSFLLRRGCVNCHSQVHGSNHPSGVKLMR